MISIENITIKNFLSVGQNTQAVNVNNHTLTLVLGENVDLGGEDGGNRNGAGKCCGINTLVKVRNTQTGEIYETTMGDLYSAAKNQS